VNFSLSLSLSLVSSTQRIVLVRLGSHYIRDDIRLFHRNNYWCWSTARAQVQWTWIKSSTVLYFDLIVVPLFRGNRTMSERNDGEKGDHQPLPDHHAAGSDLHRSGAQVSLVIATKNIRQRLLRSPILIRSSTIKITPLLFLLQVILRCCKQSYR
jgi:hypothetical protein